MIREGNGITMYFDFSDFQTGCLLVAYGLILDERCPYENNRGHSPSQVPFLGHTMWYTMQTRFVVYNLD